MSAPFLVNGAPPSSSRATMPLYNGQSPLQLGLSGLKLHQGSETICLRVFIYQCVSIGMTHFSVNVCDIFVGVENRSINSEDRQVEDASDS